jgi:uncharacterized delta-60 repeat protein
MKIDALRPRSRSWQPPLGCLFSILKLSPATLLVSLLLCPAAVATSVHHRAAAHLDPSFGNAGRVTVAYPGMRSAVLMHDDGLVLGSGQSLMKLTPNGQLDKGFGDDGTVAFPVLPDRTFHIAGLAVDSHDRIVVGGIVVGPAEDAPPPIPFGSGPPEMPRIARVVRYLPNGETDPTFGNEGVIETDFGLPAPRNTTGKQILPKPWVVVTGVAVDGEDRVVLTGGSSAGLEFGCFHDWFFNTLTYAAFVVRLTQAGALDPSFGVDGIFAGRSTSENPLHAEISSDPIIRPGGEVIYSSSYGPCPYLSGSNGISELGVDGEERGSFGAGGAIKDSFYDVAVGKAGSITTLALAGRWYNLKEPARVRVARFNLNGKPNRYYGRAAVVAPGGPEGILYTLAIDGHGRALLGGTMFSTRLFPGPTPQDEKRRRSFFAMVRLDRHGRLDRAFGPRGRIATGFGSLAVQASTLVLDSEGRALLIGTYKEPLEGVAVARYVIRR